jgi:hypothetical protein
MELLLLASNRRNAIRVLLSYRTFSHDCPFRPRMRAWDADNGIPSCGYRKPMLVREALEGSGRMQMCWFVDEYGPEKSLRILVAA